MERMMLVASVMAVVLAACTGCAGRGNAGDGAPSLSALLGEWTLSVMEAQDLATGLPKGARVPTLSVNEEGRVGGVAGINRITGSLDAAALPRGEFKLGPVASTRMAGPEGAMEFERRYLDLLSRATGFEASGGTLRLLDAGSNELLRFVRGT